MMKLEVWASESAFGLDGQDGQGELLSRRVCKLIFKMGHKTYR